MRLHHYILSLFISLRLISGETLQINPADDLYTAAQISLTQAQQAKTSSKAKVEYASAATWLNKFLSTFPNDPRAADAHYYLAISENQLGKQQKALSTFKKYLDYQIPGKMTGVSALQIALYLFNKKEFSDATSYLNVAITHLPKGKSKTLAHYSRAICFQRDSKNGDTLKNDLLYVLDQNKGKQYHEKCQFMLAGEHLKEKHYPDAYQLFQSGLKSKDPQIRSQSLHKCALLAQKLDKTEDSIALNQHVLKEKALKPHHVTSALFLMNHAAQKQDWKALISYEKYGDSGLSEELQTKRNLMLGQAYLGLNDPGKAEPYMKKVANSTAGSSLAFDAQYALLSRNKPASLNRQEAMQFLTTYKDTHSNDPRLQTIQLLLAENDFLNKHYKDALQNYEQLNPELISPENIPIIGYRLIQCHLKLNKPTGGMISQFVSNYPNDPRVPFLIFEQAKQHIATDKLDAAITSLEQIINTASVNSELKQAAELQQAKLYLKTKNYPKAETAYQTIYKTHKADKKQNSDWRFKIGYSQYQQQKYNKAAKNLLSARKFNASENALELSKYLALCAYNQKDLAGLEKELAYHQNTFKTLLPPTLYLYVALERYKKNELTKAWWGFERAINPDNKVSYETHTSSLLEAYRNTAIHTKNYQPALSISSFLKGQDLPPYQQAQNHYHAALSTYTLEGPASTQADLDAGMRLNPSGDLKYELLLLAGKVEIELGETKNGTRLLKQVALLSPQKPLKVEALNSLIQSVPNQPKNQNLLEEYKKELEKLQ